MEGIDLNNERLVANSIAVYSPAALVSIFSKAFTLQEERKVIQIRGVFLKSNKEYGGSYYDKLKDEASEHTITLITSNLIHNQLQDNKTILFNAFITRKADKYGRIEFQVNLIELINVTTNKFSEEDIKRIEIINAKLKEDVKNLDALIQRNIYNNAKTQIAVIVGRTSIIENDINTALGVEAVHYQIQYSRVALNSVSELTAEILKWDNSDVDIICVSRGGGDLLEIFNSPDLVTNIIGRKKIIASAIGHADDVTLFEKVADKKFSTPTALGTYLKSIVDQTTEEITKSKAKMLYDATVQLKTVYDGQIKNLNVKIDDMNRLHNNEKKTLLEAHEAFKKQTKEINDKRVSDLNEGITKLRAENDRIAAQLNESRKIQSQPNYTVIIVLVIVILILIITFANR